VPLENSSFVGPHQTVDLLRDGALRALLSEWRAHREDAADTQAELDRWRNEEIWPRLADLGITPRNASFSSASNCC
jgi:hypothetical protein